MKDGLEPGRGPGEEAARALMERVGARVRARRGALGIARRELSERSGVSPRYLAQLEAGEGNISIGLLTRVALALEAPVEALLAADDPLSAETAAMAELYRRADAETRTRVWQALDPARLRERKAERICLVGLRGAGKSTLGALVAADLGLPFVELRREIEETAGMPTAEIIALYGSEGYRDLEASALEDIAAARGRVVLAVAGGIVSEERTWETLLSRFHSIWLKAAPGDHMERVRAQGDLRPMAGNPMAMVQLRQLLKGREARYVRAEHVLDTAGRTVEESRAALRALIEEAGILDGAPPPSQRRSTP